MITYEYPLTLIYNGLVVIANIFYTDDYIYIISVNYKKDKNTDTPIIDAFDLTFKIDDSSVESDNIFNDLGSADRYNIYRIPLPDITNIYKVVSDQVVAFDQVENKRIDRFSLKFMQRVIRKPYISKRRAFDFSLKSRRVACEQTKTHCDAGLMTSQIQGFKVTVRFEGSDYDFNLTEKNYCPLQAKQISMMTLFKDDYKLLPSYIKHYRDLGVKHFSLYYNGKIVDLLKRDGIDRILGTIPDDIDVKICEWDLPYWFGRDGYVFTSVAQSTAMTDMLYKSKCQFEYVFFNDLDEYLFFDDKNLDCTNILHLLDKYNTCGVLQFNMYWATYINEKAIFYNPNDEIKTITYEDFNSDFNVSNFVKYSGVKNDSWRTKCIIKINSVFIVQVHGPIDSFYLKNKNGTTLHKLQLKNIRMDGFYHLLNIREKYRSRILTNLHI